MTSLAISMPRVSLTRCESPVSMAHWSADSMTAAWDSGSSSPR
jgi:hypothetical protein